MQDNADRYVAGGAVVVAALLGLVLGKPSPPPEVVPESSPTIENGVVAASEPELVTVHVSGEVMLAGLVRIDRNARVADAIAAAGGVTAAGDLERINLASPLSDGQQIIVPRTGGGPADSGSAAQGSDAVDGRLRLNTADSASLETLPGVGPVLAAKIVAHREQFGAFATVEDLLGVSGIGEQKLAGFRDLLVVP